MTDKELESLKIQALQVGDVKATLELSDYYIEMEKPDLAFQIIYRASLKQYPSAERRLGFFYEKGIGTGIDYSKAFVLYQSAANRGDNKAKHNLGLL